MFKKEIKKQVIWISIWNYYKKHEIRTEERSVDEFKYVKYDDIKCNEI